MQKRSVNQKDTTAKKMVNIRFAEERAPDRGYAQSTAASVPILGVHEKYLSTLELNDPEGIHYSCNLLSKNPIPELS